MGDAVGKIKIGAASLKDNTALHDALQTAFEAIVDDGTYEDILDEVELRGPRHRQRDV